MYTKKEALKQLRSSYRDFSDGDEWGNCISWLFAIADWCTDHTDDYPPEEWEFKQGVSGSDKDDPKYQELEAVDNAAAIKEFGDKLFVLRSKLIKQGKDY